MDYPSIFDKVDLIPGKEEVEHRDLGPFTVRVIRRSGFAAPAEVYLTTGKTKAVKGLFPDFRPVMVPRSADILFNDAEPIEGTLIVNVPMPAPAAEPSVRERFDALAAQWEAETMFISATEQLILHPAYQRIIGMGPDALPHLIDRLRGDEPYHWFWALRAIAQEDAAHGTTDVSAAVDAWLRWAEARGIAG